MSLNITSDVLYSRHGNLIRSITVSPLWAPLPIRMLSGNYIAPADSFVSSGTFASVNKVYVKAPFKVENITDTTKLTIIIQDKAGPKNKAGRWDMGEEIIILESAVPVLQSKVFHNISVARKSSVLNYTLFPAGSVINVKMRKPFAVNDEYEFSTKAMTYNSAVG
jgi:hypothetical protein